MRIIIDTNILLVSLKRSSKYRLVFQHLLEKKYYLIITNEILSEYIEIIGKKTNAEISNNLGDLLIKLENVEKVDVHFNWLLITEDPDDNKFVDAAIGGNVDFLVTNDHHFRLLKEVEFPKVNVISADEFMDILKDF